LLPLLLLQRRGQAGWLEQLMCSSSFH